MNVMSTFKKRNNDYKQGYRDGLQEGIRQAIQYIIYAVIQYLGDKRGWSRDSICKAVQWLQKHAVMIVEEYTTFNEVVEAVREEYGIIYQNNAFVFLSDEEWKHE